LRPKGYKVYVNQYVNKNRIAPIGFFSAPSTFFDDLRSFYAQKKYFQRAPRVGGWIADEAGGERETARAAKESGKPAGVEIRTGAVR
jgi:hypothetical protein